MSTKASLPSKDASITYVMTYNNVFHAQNGGRLNDCIALLTLVLTTIAQTGVTALYPP